MGIERRPTSKARERLSSRSRAIQATSDRGSCNPPPLFVPDESDVDIASERGAPVGQTPIESVDLKEDRERIQRAAAIDSAFKIIDDHF